MDTKSAERNKHRYTKSRLGHILSSIPYSIISPFSKRDKKLIIFCAMHCETFDSNSKFLFLHFLQNEPEYTVKFVINNDETRQNLTVVYGNHFIDTRTREGKKLALKAGTWVVSWLDLPIGGLFLNIRRYVLHLGHGTPLKGLGMTEKDGKLIKKLYYKLNNTNITNSLGSSEFVSEIIARCMGFSTKRVIVSGQPRTDSLFLPPVQLEDFTNDSYNILYAPTWRQHSQVKLFPFADFNSNELETFLTKNNINIYIRFHPAYEEQIPAELLQLKNIHLFSAKKYIEVMDYINCFDALITDYSSIYLDYMLLERPIMFLPYDLDEYASTVGFTMDYNENTPGPKPETFAQFLSILTEMKDNPKMLIDLIIKLNVKLNNPNKDSCKYLGDLIKSKCQK
ncbi:MAG: CDP-glycerol glycerophosphotransferase family protein [Treponema sp.]|nr:CDP-glycerol glycerophosphotransferase family protein [Treponema sp.]